MFQIRSSSSLDIFYTNATFEVHSKTADVAKGAFNSGIRQGCPLSPYLFVIVLSVIMHDVDDALLTAGTPMNTWSVAHPHYDLEYADDTLLLALTTPQLQKFLHTVETESELYGMHLNTTKAEVLEDPRYDTRIMHFKNGCQVPVSTKVKYLGVHVSWTKPFEAAFLHRRALAEEAFKKLRLVWNSSMNFKEKRQIFQSVFIGTLIYGLDTLSLTTPQLQRVDAYYFRFLRRICKIPASYTIQESPIIPPGGKLDTLKALR